MYNMKQKTNSISDKDNIISSKIILSIILSFKLPFSVCTSIYEDNSCIYNEKNTRLRYINQYNYVNDIILQKQNFICMRTNFNVYIVTVIFR